MYFDFYYAILFFLIFICSILIIGILLLKFKTKNDLKKIVLQSKLNQQKVFFPLKVKAIERYALYLERIRIENLITRINPVSDNLQHYKLFLSATIEQEFNHNAVQKIYISKITFQYIEKATQALLDFLNIPSSKDISITQFNTASIKKSASINKDIESALLQLKLELNN